jgi:hypothetical protein
MRAGSSYQGRAGGSPVLLSSKHRAQCSTGVRVLMIAFGAPHQGLPRSRRGSAEFANPIPNMRVCTFGAIYGGPSRLPRVESHPFSVCRRHGAGSGADMREPTEAARIKQAAPPSGVPFPPGGVGVAECGVGCSRPRAMLAPRPRQTRRPTSLKWLACSTGLTGERELSCCLAAWAANSDLARQIPAVPTQAQPPGL